MKAVAKALKKPSTRSLELILDAMRITKAEAIQRVMNQSAKPMPSVRKQSK